MKRFAFILLCLLCTAGGLALGRYAWAAPVDDAPVMRPSSSARPAAQSSIRSIQQSLAELRSGPRRAALLLSLAARGDRRQLPSLIEACAHDAAALQFLADTWLQADPNAFVRALAASKAIRGRHREQCAETLWSVLERWGKKAPDDAWRTVESLPGPLRRLGLWRLAAKRIEADPRAGLEFLKAHPGLTPGFVDLPKINNAPELLPLIQSLPESACKMQLLRETLQGLPLAEALTHLDATPEYGTVMTRSTLIRRVAQRSLEEAITFHASASGPNRMLAARFISHELLSKAPGAAVTWAQDHLSGSERTATIKRAAENLEASDPAAAAAARALLPENQRATVE
jgi:hypothetical protein